MKTFKIQTWFNENEFFITEIESKSFANACLKIEKAQNKLFRPIKRFELIDIIVYQEQA